MVDDLDIEAIRTRLNPFFVDAIERLRGPKATARELTARGHPVKERTVASWREGRYYPSVDVAAVLAALAQISLDQYLFTETPSSVGGVAETVREHGRRLAELEGWLHELAADRGFELGASTAEGERPDLTLARAQRMVAELTAAIDRLREKEA